MTVEPGELTSADRNREDILVVLRDVVPEAGSILEIASGAGKHAAQFAAEFAPRVWQASEYDPNRIETMRARFSGLDLPNLRNPILLDVSANSWPVEADWPDPPIRMIYNVNMIHIAPWSACLGLLAGAARILRDDGVLFIYGPFHREGIHTSEGNAEFDRSLRAQNAEWGLRDLTEVCDAAGAAGLSLDRVVEMPVNNLSVVFRAAR
jgi:SAM-dependent methyltransferase